MSELTSNDGHELLAIRWIDSRRGAESFYNPEELRAFPCANIWTIGFGFELDNRVVLAAEFYSDSNTQAEGYRGIYSIPKECIKEIKRLSVIPSQGAGKELELNG